MLTFFTVEGHHNDTETMEIEQEEGHYGPMN
jgi:hypothetical protein